MNELRLNWDNLRIFLAVARTQSAAEAAGLLGLDHSTVTRRLHRLERELSTPLFDRTPQGHRLNAAGEQLLETAERIESALLQADARIGGDARVLRGQVRLGATEGFGNFFIAPRLADFCARHPGLTVDLMSQPRLVSLPRREADLAVSVERPDSGAYVVTRLAQYRLCIYATPGYLDRSPAITTPADLRLHRFIGYVDELAYSAELRYLERLAPGSPVALRSTSLVAQYQAARRGHALAVLPCFIGDPDPGLVRVLPDAADVIRTFWLVAPAERRELARVRALWDFLREAARANQDFLMGAG